MAPTTAFLGCAGLCSSCEPSLADLPNIATCSVGKNHGGWKNPPKIPAHVRAGRAVLPSQVGALSLARETLSGIVFRLGGPDLLPVCFGPIDQPLRWKQ